MLTKILHTRNLFDFTERIETRVTQIRVFACSLIHVIVIIGYGYVSSPVSLLPLILFFYFGPVFSAYLFIPGQQRIFSRARTHATDAVSCAGFFLRKPFYCLKSFKLSPESNRASICRAFVVETYTLGTLLG